MHAVVLHALRHRLSQLHMDLLYPSFSSLSMTQVGDMRPLWLWQARWLSTHTLWLGPISVQPPEATPQSQAGQAPQANRPMSYILRSFKEVLCPGSRSRASPGLVLRPYAKAGKVKGGG